MKPLIQVRTPQLRAGMCAKLNVASVVVKDNLKQP
jgi:hypothetical protein